MKSCSVVSLSLSFFFIRIFSTEAARQCLYHDCPNTTLFTPNSTHQPNLPTLPSFLSSATTHTTDGFTIATADQNPPDLAYRSEKKVTVAEANFTLSCALAQCTQDFTASDCVTCLQIGVANVSEWKQDGRLPASSCSLRYELYPIYNASALPSPVPPPAAPVTGPEAKSNKSSVIIVGVALSVGPTVVFLFLAWCFSWRNATMTRAVVLGDQIGINNITNSESLRYDLATIRATTDNFSHQNKLGEGRFGRVYKGMLPSGQPTAVKRVSRSSRQGAEEFKNEVMLLPKLQHQNLVQLLGFCLEGEEKLLVYEFVPNQSLDYFLFDSEKSRQLDWSTRYKIACGIAGGLLYLHEDSRLQIIHGDLKPSNILLDSKMNPKISDFSMARVFGVDQIDAYPIRIARNRVYISPEFEMRGQISVKSDIYSFGVLLLELITGKPNSFSNQADGGESIASYAWKNWRDGTPLAVLDPAIGETYSRDEILRCLKIGLLCAQKDPDDRPTMADIVLEISSHPVVPVELPQQPAFFLSRTERPMEELKTDQSIHGG